MYKKILLVFLCNIMGAVFLVSGFTKLLPFIEPFEFSFVDLGGSWRLAPYIARMLIATEFFIGALLFFNITLRKKNYKAAIALLIVFSVYLILLITLTGNKGNCGCFGSFIVMTPLQALIKNIIMLVILFFLMKHHTGWQLKNKWKYITPIILITAVALPFILNPIELDYSEAYLNKPKDNYQLELDSLYVHAKLAEPPKILSQGKHLIAFLSLTCQHCRIAAKKMQLIHQRKPDIPIYFVLNGNPEKLNEFFEDTHSEDIPHCTLPGRPFIYLAGTTLPSIYLVNNSVVEHELNYFNLDEEEVERWAEHLSP